MRATPHPVLILIRHGQSTANDAGLLVGRTDSQLTDKGIRQALEVAPYTASVARVICSPLTRARRTAELAVPQLTAEVDEAFIELDYGLLDGTPLADVGREQWDAFAANYDLALGGGESLRDVDRRVHARLNEWLADEESLLHHPGEHLCVVSHVSPIKSAIAWALGVPGSVAWRMRLDNASITTITTRNAQPFLVTYNERSPRHHRAR